MSELKPCPVEDAFEINRRGSMGLICASCPNRRADQQAATDRVLMREWAANLRLKAWLIRKGVCGMADSCDELARIIEEYVERTSNTGMCQSEIEVLEKWNNQETASKEPT